MAVSKLCPVYCSEEFTYFPNKLNRWIELSGACMCTASIMRRGAGGRERSIILIVTLMTVKVANL